MTGLVANMEKSTMFLAGVQWSAMVYHAWKARNWTIFKGKTVNTELVLTQIKEETIERIGIAQLSKKARRCQNIIQRITCN